MRVVSNMIFKLKASSLVINSAWGVIANILQNIFNSLFFVLIARYYTSEQLGHFLLSNTVYQLVAVFSSMGLSSWFVREYTSELDKYIFTNRYFKLQGFLGILFYIINVLLIFSLYSDYNIRFIGVVLGLNIIFDNTINSIKSLNIAKSLQKRTANVLVMDGFFKLVVSVFCVYLKFPIIYLAFALVFSRVITLNIFMITGGYYKNIVTRSVGEIVSYTYLKEVVFSNWRFVVIGSVSVVYWSFANIVISKFMPVSAVSQYEIASRIFSLTIIIPIIISGSVYPQFVQYFNDQDKDRLRVLYDKMFVVYTLFSLISYSFIVAFAPKLIPFIFGDKYQTAIFCIIQMFLAILVFPTTLLQANLIVAMKLENLDMWFNLTSLIMHVFLSIIGLYFFKSLSVINYSIFMSFIVFHISQDVVLIRRKITTLSRCFRHYVLLASFVSGYHFLLKTTNAYFAFGLMSCAVLIVIGFTPVYKRKIIIN
ncbi:oligosaccharide flippase family protein [Hymenobacter sp. GOD-10R]|uniref:oligosaccharide flippase family protein n=1 Tax=Hymenobacter sp. GOD-10R TaxID=3093922 RepID=UPI002D7913E5|nr:oligosaccharide flippase family protein [Hymenobacter sp. GOD-10R]WRQ30347.1 oligosaccharide flippase family protein [Hymenobacter sp. GOD-10R]